MEKRIELEMRGRPANEIEELNLDNCRATTIEGLTSEFKNLESLSLINVGLTTLKGFPALPNLRKLELSDNRISSGLNLLQGCAKLVSLNLSGNKIGCKGVGSLAQGLRVNRALAELDLNSCRTRTLAPASMGLAFCVAMSFPKGNVPPPTTAEQCEVFKHKIKPELRIAYGDAVRRTNSLPDLHREKNSYMGFFADERHPVSEEHKFTYDQLKDNAVFDPKNPKETFHNRHTEAIRRRCAMPLRTRWMVRTSQAYGWLPPIDDAKLGFGRASVYTADAMDVSHQNCGAASGSSAPVTG